MKSRKASTDHGIQIPVYTPDQIRDRLSKEDLWDFIV